MTGRGPNHFTANQSNTAPNPWRAIGAALYDYLPVILPLGLGALVWWLGFLLIDQVEVAVPADSTAEARIAAAAASAALNQLKPFLSAGFGLLFGVAASQAIVDVGLRRRFEALKAEARAANEAYAALNSTVLTLGSYGGIVQALASTNHSQNVRAIGLAAVRDALSGVRLQAPGAEGGGVEVHGQALALTVYSSIWEALVGVQHHLAAPGLDPGKRGFLHTALPAGTRLQANITHSNSIDIWRGKESRQLMELQAEFRAHGGRITRIFICRKPENLHAPGAFEAYGQLLQRYQDTMALMERNYGIDCYFMEAEPDSEALASDCLIVEGLDLAVMWNSDIIGREIDRCEIIEGEARIRRSRLAFRTICRQQAQWVEDLENTLVRQALGPWASKHYDLRNGGEASDL